MNPYENPNELPREDAGYEVISQPSRQDGYTYYSGAPNTSGEYRYVPKKKKKKGSWGRY